MATAIHFESKAEYVDWLRSFPAKLQMSADELFSAYRAGQVQETDEVWLWAEMWSDHTEHLAAQRRTMSNRSEVSGFFSGLRTQPIWPTQDPILGEGRRPDLDRRNHLYGVAA